MKKFYTLIIALLIANSAISQTGNPCESCLPDGMWFETQSQIDSFPINHPICTEILGDIIVQGDDITNINAFSMVTLFSGDLQIGMGAISLGNPLLKNLSGLENVTSIGGDLNIYYNDSLNSIVALESLGFLGGQLGIGYNPQLSSLESLIALDTVDGLYLGFLWSLKDLSGLENLRFIDGPLHITMCNQLKNLSELNNLIAINGDLWISSNWVLSSLSGLDNINESSIYNLFIGNNDSLSTCEVQSICDYIASPNGNVSIVDNFIGCNSQQEVEEACESISIKEENQLQVNKIYPNPAHASITIELPTQPSINTSLTISSTNGQQLITQPINEPQTDIDISQLPNGIYIVKVWNDKDVMVQKVIKQ